MTIDAAIEIYEESGGHFFDEGAMNFFNSEIESGLIEDRFFITSERMNYEDPKRYTIREFVDDYTNIEDFSGFCEFKSFDAAIEEVYWI